MADVDVDAGGAQAVEHLVLADVDARHGVAHLRQRQRDRAHPGPADADHVQPLRRREIEGREWARRAVEAVVAAITVGSRLDGDRLTACSG